MEFWDQLTLIVVGVLLVAGWCGKGGHHGS